MISLHGIRFLLFCTILATVSCSKPKKPEFVRIKSIDVREFTEEKVTMAAVAVLYNPNGYSVTVKEIDVFVTINDQAVGKVNQIGDIWVPARDELEVPLVVEFAPDEVYDNLLSGLINFIMKGKLDVHYQGVIRMKVKGIVFKVPIDHNDQVKI